MNYIVNYLHDAGKSVVCLCTVVSCEAYSFMDFCQKKMSHKKKCHKKKKKERKKRTKKRKKTTVTPRWIDISGPSPAKFLSKSSMYYVTMILHNPVNMLNVVSTNTFS